ncbi:MAG: hypothetical protein IKL89_07140 [Clostridia bacterium]|nr:hypothetical protein [Clostridia bacterium]
MIGFVWFLLCLLSGAAVCLLIAPSFAGVLAAKPLIAGKHSPRSWMLWIPASFICGIMLNAWISYLAALCAAGGNAPMTVGAAVSALVSLLLCAAAIILRRDLLRKLLADLKARGIKTLFSENRAELIFCLVVLLFWAVLVIRSFYHADGALRVGHSVFSDFCPHLSVIRSFSEGGNIPAQYPHFADGTIRYHFMFQFAVGMLEYLGMRMDIAFNLLSLGSILAMMMLFYVLSLQLTRSRAVAILASVFFTFRSSFAIFTYLFGAEEGVLGAIKTLFTSMEHIGNTQSESWGLWTQKVYLNQRHLPLGFAVAFFAIICFYPYLREMVDSLREAKGKKGARWKAFALSREGWLPEGIVMPVFMGLLLGALGFFNGAVLISVLSVLFFMAILSRRRLSYLITACIAVALVLLQSRLFIPSGGAAVSPRLTFGFLAESPALADIIAYLVELLGILPFVIVFFLPVMPRGMRWLTLAFTAPVLVAECLQLTPDITVNHKYIMFGCVLLDIIAASAVAFLWSKKQLVLRGIAAVLVILMTLTGAADLITQWSLDRYTVSYPDVSPVQDFVRENCPEGSVFLTDTTYTLGDILLAGRPLYCGWSYYAWSAGYDTFGRTQKVAEIYSAKDADTLRRLLAEEGIDYVYVDDSNRKTEEYAINEALIEETLRMVYRDSYGGVYIYAVDPS